MGLLRKVDRSIRSAMIALQTRLAVNDIGGSFNNLSDLLHTRWSRETRSRHDHCEIASKIRSLANWNGYRHDIYRMWIITRNKSKRVANWMSGCFCHTIYHYEWFIHRFCMAEMGKGQLKTCGIIYLGLFCWYVSWFIRSQRTSITMYKHMICSIRGKSIM